MEGERGLCNYLACEQALYLGLTRDFFGARLFEGCPIHPTRVDSSLVFAIRSNRHESFPLVSIRYNGSRFARDLENIASRLNAGWVENVVESTRIVSLSALCRVG